MHYLFDTSAIKGLRRAHEEIIHKKGINVSASPYSFYELFVHLGDMGGLENENDAFLENKAKLMKISQFEILRDPMESIANKIKIAQNDPIEPDLVPKALEVIRPINDYRQFQRTAFPGYSSHRNRIRGKINFTLSDFLWRLKRKLLLHKSDYIV